MQIWLVKIYERLLLEAMETISLFIRLLLLLVSTRICLKWTNKLVVSPNAYQGLMDSPPHFYGENTHNVRKRFLDLFSIYFHIQ